MDPSSVSPYSYDLPADRIAQRPVRPYDAARLLVVDTADNSLADNRFTAFPNYLTAADVLVFNNSRVMPARLFGELGSGARIELLLLNETEENVWRCLARPMKKLKAGVRVLLPGGLCAFAQERSDAAVLLKFERIDPGAGTGSLRAALYEQGCMPIPPYIRAGAGDADDAVDYQSLFAECDGSVAAPTASLHFTPELLANCRAVGSTVETLTLHVGTASFLPLWKDDNESVVTPPQSERFVHDEALIERLEGRRRSGGRVIAVGTTVVRALESMARDKGGEEGATDLFIYPGYDFQIVDAIVTNFHQPRTTHLLLVQAFIGSELLEHSYQHALSGDYRFLSYGDGMLLK